MGALLIGHDGATKHPLAHRKESPGRMRSSGGLGFVDAAFDGAQLMSDAGFPQPATLGLRPGFTRLVTRFLGPGRAAGRMPGQPPDPDPRGARGWRLQRGRLLPYGRAGRSFSSDARSTMGTFQRSFRRGHVRQLNRVSAKVLPRDTGAERQNADSRRSDTDLAVRRALVRQTSDEARHAPGSEHG